MTRFRKHTGRRHGPELACPGKIPVEVGPVSQMKTANEDRQLLTVGIMAAFISILLECFLAVFPKYMIYRYLLYLNYGALEHK